MLLRREALGDGIGLFYGRAVEDRCVTRWPDADRLVLALAALVLVLAAASSDEPSGIGNPRGLDALAIGLLCVGAGLVVVAGRFPAVAAASAMALTFGWYGVGYQSGLVNVVTLAAFYRLGRNDTQRTKLIVVGASVVASLVMIVGVGGESWWEGFTASGYVVMAVLFGELIRSRHLVVERYAAEAEQAQRDAERRIAEERLQIARDVHDLLAHTVSSMTVQAGVAVDALDRDRGAVREALASIRRSGRDAMAEMRATVSVLRSGAEPPATTPVPRLDRLEELVDAARVQGVEVSLEVNGLPEAVPELVELTVYRIVQESLTNVVRHASATDASITVGADGSGLCVEVHDGGRGAPAGTAGFGLRGMSERVASVGGELWHGVDDDGGWTVRARLPLPAAV